MIMHKYILWDAFRTVWCFHSTNKLFNFNSNFMENRCHYLEIWNSIKILLSCSCQNEIENLVLFFSVESHATVICHCIGIEELKLWFLFCSFILYCSSDKRMKWVQQIKPSSHVTHNGYTNIVFIIISMQLNELVPTSNIIPRLNIEL